MASARYIVHPDLKKEWLCRIIPVLSKQCPVKCEWQPKAKVKSFGKEKKLKIMTSKSLIAIHGMSLYVWRKLLEKEAEWARKADISQTELLKVGKTYKAIIWLTVLGLWPKTYLMPFITCIVFVRVKTKSHQRMFNPDSIMASPVTSVLNNKNEVFYSHGKIPFLCACIVKVTCYCRHTCPLCLHLFRSW